MHGIQLDMYFTGFSFSLGYIRRLEDVVYLLCMSRI